MLCLDTSVLIDIQCDRKVTLDRLKQLVAKHPAPGCIAFITYFEYYYGLMKIKKKEKAYGLLDSFIFLRPTKKTAEILAQLKKESEDKGLGLPLADLLIASQVRENNLTLVTKDKDFLKVKRIDVEMI